MDMQSIAPPQGHHQEGAVEAVGDPSSSSALLHPSSNKRKNHKNQKAILLSKISASSDDNNPPLLMMSSSQESTAGCDQGGDPSASSPSKRLLLDDNASSSSNNNNNGQSKKHQRATKKHTKKRVMTAVGGSKKASSSNNNGSSSIGGGNSSSSSSKGGILSSKLSRALFGTKSSNTFSKMNDSADRGSNKSKFRTAAARSSPFIAATTTVERDTRIQNNNYNAAIDFGDLVPMPSDEQLSFDNTSTHGDDHDNVNTNGGDEEEEEPFDSPKHKQRMTMKKQKSTASASASASRSRNIVSPALSVGKSSTSPTAKKLITKPPVQRPPKGPVIELHGYHHHDVSNLSASESGSLKSATTANANSVPALALVPTTQPQSTMVACVMTVTATAVSGKACSVASTASSLNYSECESSTADHNHTNKVLSLSVPAKAGSPPAVSTAVVVTPVTPTQSIIEDLDSSMSEKIKQVRLLDRLDQVATTFTNPSTASFVSAPPSNSCAFATKKNKPKVLPLLKPPPPPPPLPPQSSRRNGKPSLNTSRESQSSLLSSSSSSSRPPLSPQEEARILKQYEERLLQGGDFLNESGSTATSGTSGELAMQLLSRLEAANADPQFLTNHHNQDPPLVMSTSFGSSTAMAVAAVTATTITNNRRPSGCGSTSSSAAAGLPPLQQQKQQPRRLSNSSSVIANKAYAEFMTEGKPSKDYSAHSHSRSVFSSSSRRKSAGVVEDSSDDDSKSAPRINYLYSQDNEFENSILSPPSVYSNISSHPGGGTTVEDRYKNSSSASSRSRQEQRTNPRSPKTMYRSDAINAFLERADCMGPDSQTVGSPARNCNNKSLVAPLTAVEHEEVVLGEDDSPVEEKPKKASDEFLNIVTGCTGGPAPELSEKLVALEAGWSSLRTQANEKMQNLEESWQHWNLNSLLRFSKDGGDKDKKAKADTTADPPATDKSASVVTPTVMGFTTVLTTPASMWTAKKPQTNQMRVGNGGSIAPKNMFRKEEIDGAVHAVECTLNGKLVTHVLDSSTSQDEVILGVVKELRSSRLYTGPSSELENIVMGSEEHDVPFYLANQLADLSMIDDANGHSSSDESPGYIAGHMTKRSQLQSSTCLNSSRGEDSEGGKVVLDAAEWDPLEASDGDIDIDIDLSADPTKHQGYFYKNNTGKVLRSPTSVLVEI